MLNKKVKFCLLILLILTIFSMKVKAINPDNMIESTKVSERLNTTTFNFTLIHPDEYISYLDINFLEEIEQELKKDYDLVLAEFRLRETTFEDFNLYEFKNNSKLTVDGETVESVDFFDISFSPRASRYWSSSAARYRGRGSVRITGYLLFPKIIDENSKDVKLEGYYKSIPDNGYTLYLSDDWDESSVNNILGYNVKWDFEKIDRLIDILKN